MWQRFTERTRRAIFFAQEEAARLGVEYVGTEHLLLGLAREDDSPAARILERLGVSLRNVRQEIERQVSREDGELGREMQLTAAAKRVIDLAYEEARELNNNYIGTEHLLLGIARQPNDPMALLLAGMGAPLDLIQAEVRALQDNPALLPRHQREGTSRPDTPAMLFRVDLNRRLANIFSNLPEDQWEPEIRDAFEASLETLRAARHAASGAEQDAPAEEPARLAPETPDDVDHFRGQCSGAARTLLERAIEEAVLRREEYVGTEHLLLAICSEPEGPAARLLERLGTPVDRVRVEVERQVPSGDGGMRLNYSLSPRARRVLDAAAEEARLMDAPLIGPEHLLLGLIAEPDGIGGRVLARLGVEIDAARREARKLGTLDGPEEG